MARHRVDKGKMVLLFALFVGLAVMLYPTISNWWNSFHSSLAVTNYSETVDSLDEAQKEAMLSEARAFNAQLADAGEISALSAVQKERYEQLLNPGNDGIMGSIEIPTLGVKLPLYHGAEEAVLQVGAGHLEWTSLPVGGESTHCVLSGHRGLPTARLFTDIDKLSEGDVFILRVLDEVLYYQVDQKKTVLPDQIDDLRIEEGKDYCTLVTCTPYGINTHRLLVRGHRIDAYDGLAEEVGASDAKRVLGGFLVAAVVLLGGIALVLRKLHQRRILERKGGMPLVS